MTAQDRASLYHDPTVQLLLHRLIKGENIEILPERDLMLSARYLEVESIVDESHWGATDLLETLSNSGILKRKFCDKILVCPHCASANVRSDYLCPSCNSLEIEAQSFAEHVSCGAVDIYNNFSKDGILFCENCHREIPDAERSLRQASGFLCLQCRVKSKSPELVHRCKNCQHMFSVRDVRFVSVYSFSLGPKAEEEFKQVHLVIKPVAAALNELRFNVEMPGQMTGRSGVVHRFDAVARGEASEVVVIDVIASAEPILEASVAALVAKAFDLEKALPILVTIPSVSEKARMLGALYKIWIIEAPTSDAAAGMLRAGFEWMGLDRTREPSGDLQV